MSINIAKYIKNISEYDKKIVNNMNFEINKKIYRQGENFKYASPNSRAYYVLIFSKIIQMIYKSYKRLFQYNHSKNLIKKGGEIGKKEGNSDENVFLVDIPFLDKELKEIGYTTLVSPRKAGFKNIKIMIQTIKLRKIFLYGDLKNLFSKKTINYIIEYKEKLREIYKQEDIKAIFVNNNVTFFENLSLDIFDELQKPSFEFVHGCPGIYRSSLNKSNYTLVRGEKMKENFVRLGGMDPNKVLVTGHPYYQTLPKRELRFGLENILVLNKSNSWTGGIYREDSIAGDIGASIYYLYSIENTLKKHGVKSVRLRIHPDEDMNRYKKHINTDFFIFDKEPLSESLNKSTLVIGPGSTVFLESIYHGVNYLFYEPGENNIDCMNFPLTPPFDGSDSKAPVARNEEMLFKMIEQKKMLDKSIFNDYIKTPFDIGFLKGLIK